MSGSVFIRKSTTQILEKGQTTMAESIPVVLPSNQSAVPMIASEDSVLDSNNTTSSNLTSGSIFTGTWTDVSNYSHITISAFSNVASASNGLVLQWSHNASTVIESNTVTLLAGVANRVTSGKKWQHFRVRYTNGGTGTTTLAIQTFLSKTALNEVVDGTVLTAPQGVTVFGYDGATMRVLSTDIAGRLTPAPAATLSRYTYETFTVGTSSMVTALGSSTRTSLNIANRSANNIYFKFDDVPALEDGFWLPPKWQMSFDKNSGIIIGAIFMIADAAGSVVLVNEGQS